MKPGTKAVGIVAEFKVPKVNCAGSIPAKIQDGNYSWATFWAGLDGGDNDTKTIEQAGVTVSCQTATSAPVYRAFHEIGPGAGDDHFAKFTVHGGDTMLVTVQDEGVGSVQGLGHTYELYELDVTTGRYFDVSGRKYSEFV